RTRLATAVEALLAHPQWAAAVEGALDSDDRAAPLDAIATGPADELGLGPAFAVHACLDAIVPDLASHPGAGWPAIHAALRSPVVRNRNMAVRTLAAWPRSAWPPGAAAALELARDEEPADDVRERIAATLTGQGLD
ncbi:MAG: hypothetical protein R3F61_39190, partial [Myxococcota bacterium]